MTPAANQLITLVVSAAVMTAGSWFGLDEIGKAKKSADAMAIHYVPALAQCEAKRDARLTEQRSICRELLEAERENTAQWRAQCRSTDDGN